MAGRPRRRSGMREEEREDMRDGGMNSLEEEDIVYV